MAKGHGPQFNNRQIDITDSEWISHIQYDPDSLTLDVATRKGARYRFQAVGTDTFAKLIMANSSGAYFNAHIKGKFRNKKLPKPRVTGKLLAL